MDATNSSEMSGCHWTERSLVAVVLRPVSSDIEFLRGEGVRWCCGGNRKRVFFRRRPFFVFFLRLRPDPDMGLRLKSPEPVCVEFSMVLMCGGMCIILLSIPRMRGETLECDDRLLRGDPAAQVS